MNIIDVYNLLVKSNIILISTCYFGSIKSKSLKKYASFVDKVNKEAYLGFWDWRIPEKDEAEKLYMPDSTIMARSKAEIHIDQVFEPGGGNGCWCLPFDQQAAFYFSYTSGNSQQFDQDYSQGYVRLVRLYPND